MLAQPLRGAVIAHGQLARGWQVIDQWADLCSPSRNVVSKMISFSVAPAEKHLVGTGTRRCTLRACRTAERIISIAEPSRSRAERRRDMKHQTAPQPDDATK